MAVKNVKADAVIAAAVEQARQAVLDETENSDFGVGEYQGFRAEGDRLGSHLFECTHSGYLGWHWAVSVTRAARSKRVTVDEISLLPGEQALVAPPWIPWEQRVLPGDITPGVLLPTSDSDPRLEPGYTGGEMADDADPVAASLERAVVAELGLGRERVLSQEGRAQAAQRWLESDGGPNNAMTRYAPGTCAACGYFVRLQGRLGGMFGACCNEYSPSDASVVSVDHGCGGHSDVPMPSDPNAELPLPVWDTLTVDHDLFD